MSGQPQHPPARGPGDAAKPSSTLQLAVPAEVLDALAERAAAIVVNQIEAEAEPWLDVPAAAAHLACGKSRIYALTSAGRIPHHRDGSRLLFRRTELDAWVRAGGEQRP